MTCPHCGGETATWTEQQLTLPPFPDDTAKQLDQCHHCNRLEIRTREAAA